MAVASAFVRLMLVIFVLLGSTAPTYAAPPEQPAPPDIRFGAVEAYFLPDKAAALRVGWDRMVLQWYVRQPDNAVQWNVPGEETERVNTAIAAGREMVMLLMGTPGWASDVARPGGVPRGLYLPVNDPGNLWASFVRRSVGEYAGRVNHWIIWNEPDIAVEDYGAQFEGSLQDYYQLLKVAYVVAKQANPKAVIHLGGVTHWHDVVHGRTPYLQRLFDLMRKDPSARANNAYFDVATLHIYFRTDSVFDLITFYRNLLSRYGLRQPIWLNETNAAPYDDPKAPWNGPMFKLTMEQQAAFIVQSTALALAAGAERVAVYKWSGDNAIPGADSYGLFRNDGSPRPAAEAYRAVTTHFAGTRRITYVAFRTHYLVRLERGGAVTRVLWARGSQAITVRLRAAPRTNVALYDHKGAAYPLAPDRNGLYTLNLPAADCRDPAQGCLIGGTPWILVETAR